MSDRHAARLHFLYDPLCGWSYGALPLLAIAAQRDALTLELHGAGLWVGHRRPHFGISLQAQLLFVDQQITVATGQPFGDRYFNRLLLDRHKYLDSEPPLRALLAVIALGGDGLRLLQAMQAAFFQRGEWLSDPALLAELAAEQQIAPAALEPALASVDLLAHLRHSQQWQQRINAPGFPALALEQHGHLYPIDLRAFHADPLRFADYLDGLLAMPADA